MSSRRTKVAGVDNFLTTIPENSSDLEQVMRLVKRLPLSPTHAHTHTLSLSRQLLDQPSMLVQPAGASAFSLPLSIARARAVPLPPLSLSLNGSADFALPAPETQSGLSNRGNCGEQRGHGWSGMGLASETAREL